MALAGSLAHKPLGTVRKALELDRRKCGFSDKKGQTEKREKKRELSHDPVLLLRSIRASQRPHQAASAPPPRRK
jgi:hypothetical protein